jgi:hypothetical protein
VGGEQRCKRSAGVFDAHGHAQRRERRDGQPGESARVDGFEGREVHRDVHGHAVVSAAVPHLEPQRGDLRFAAVAKHVDARRARLAVRGNAGGREKVYHRRFDRPHHRPHRTTGTAEVEKQVRDQLAGTVVRHLAAAIGLDEWNPARVMHVLATARETQRIDGRVLGEPDFVSRRRRSRAGERLHRTPALDVVGDAERADFDGGGDRAGASDRGEVAGRRRQGRQSTIATIGCDVSSR